MELTIVEGKKRKRRVFKPRTFKPRKPRNQVKRRHRKPKRKNLVKELDAVFSRFIRQSGANSEGMVKCFTCPKVMHWKSAQNSHYVSRSVRSLRWSENNCRIGCYGCNVMHGGNLITYRENLVGQHGEMWVRSLEAERHRLFKPTDEWLQANIEVYTQKIAQLSQINQQ